MTSGAAKSRRLLAMALAAGLLAGACSRGERTAPVPPATTTPPTPDVTFDREDPVTTDSAPEIVLSDGSANPIRRDVVPVVEGDALTDDEFDDVLAQLPEWDLPDDDDEDFSDQSFLC